MHRVIHFLRYDNAVPIALGVIVVGATSAFAATNPEAIYSETQEVLSVDNTYIVEKDLADYTPRVEITGVTEDELNYTIAFTFWTIDVQDFVWQDVERQEHLQVEKQFLGGTRDLGLYATEQLKQLIANDLARLTEVQVAERTRISQKVVATAYGGLIGTFLDETTEALPGYTPVVTPPKPNLSQNSPVVLGDPRERPVSVTQAELEALIERQVNDALAAHRGAVAGAATSTASADDMAAAGAQNSGVASEAPDGSSANEIPVADEGTVADDDDDSGTEAATSSAEVGSPAKDNGSVSGADRERIADEPEHAQLEAANDNSPAGDLPAIGTE